MLIIPWLVLCVCSWGPPPPCPQLHMRLCPACAHWNPRQSHTSVTPAAALTVRPFPPVPLAPWCFCDLIKWPGSFLVVVLPKHKDGWPGAKAVKGPRLHSPLWQAVPRAARAGGPELASCPQPLRPESLPPRTLRPGPLQHPRRLPPLASGLCWQRGRRRRGGAAPGALRPFGRGVRSAGLRWELLEQNFF